LLHLGDVLLDDIKRKRETHSSNVVGTCDPALLAAKHDLLLGKRDLVLLAYWIGVGRALLAWWCFRRCRLCSSTVCLGRFYFALLADDAWRRLVVDIIVLVAGGCAYRI